MIEVPTNKVNVCQTGNEGKKGPLPVPNSCTMCRLYSCWISPCCPLMMLEEAVNDAEEKRKTGKTEKEERHIV